MAERAAPDLKVRYLVLAEAFPNADPYIHQ